MELRLRRCTVRSWRLEDKDSLVRHANNRKVWLNVRDIFPHPYTALDADRWLELAVSQNPETQFAIAIDGSAVGGIGALLKSDVYRQNAEIGYWLGEAFWGRGVATETVSAFTRWLFEHFPVQRIYAGVFAWNTASVRVLEKAAFVFEGRLRRSVIKDGKVTDELVYSLLADREAALSQ